MNDLLTLRGWKAKELTSLLQLTKKVKKNPYRYARKLQQQSVLLLFEAPSLRTKISSSVAITQLGGSAIDYSLTTSPWGVGKETIEDTGAVLSRYCHGIIARLNDHAMLEKLAHSCSIPVINGMTNEAHPLQLLGDLFTIKEKFGHIEGLSLAYLGDGNNNVTFSIMYACAIMGIHCTIVSPKVHHPPKKVVEYAHKLCETSGCSLRVTDDVKVVKHMDVIYTDSWMSYHIAKKEQAKRRKVFAPYQVTPMLFHHSPQGLFMHCLPAGRGQDG